MLFFCAGIWRSKLYSHQWTNQKKYAGEEIWVQVSQTECGLSENNIVSQNNFPVEKGQANQAFRDSTRKIAITLIELPHGIIGRIK